MLLSEHLPVAEHLPIAMPGWERPEDVPRWAKHKPPTEPPRDMAAFLRSPPEPPRSCPEGKSLWLRSQCLDDSSAEVFARTMMNGDWKHLEYITLAANHFTANGMIAIALALAQGKCPLLENLDISETNIGEAGAMALACALKAMPKLRSLIITQAGIGEAGGTALFAAIRDGSSPALQQIYLKGNPVGDASMEMMCKASASGNLSQLQSMNLDQTHIGDEGCLVLANSIEAGEWDHMRTINMMGIKASRDGFEVVTDVIKEYEKSLKCFY